MNIVPNVGEVPTSRVLRCIAEERARQEKLWGQQNHLIVPYPDIHTMHKAMADAWKRTNALRVERGELAWDGILLEEVFEALAEADPAAMRAELVQAAAVIVNMIECLDRGAT